MSDIRKLLESFDNMTNEDDAVLLEGDAFDIEINENFIIETGILGFTEDGIIVLGDDSMLEFLDLNGILVENTDMFLDEDGRFKIRRALAGIALLVSLWGVEKHNAEVAYKNSPQLQALTSFYEQAKEQGDERMMKQLKNRISNHEMRLSLGKGEVRGANDMPIDVVYDKEGKMQTPKLDEAEYQGRKVPLNKPMKGDVKKSKVYVKKPDGKVVKVNFGDKNMRIKKSNPTRRKSFRARHNCENPGPKWKARYWSCRAW